MGSENSGARGKANHFYKHGKAKDPLYNICTQMIARCHNPNNASYYNYGARGITVCDEWRYDRSKFVDWAKENGYRKGLSIDRIDNSKGYSPDNCRWVERLIQQNNTRRNRYLTVDGETHSISEWARIKGISKNSIETRLRRGMSEEEAVKLPLKRGWFEYRSLDPKDYLEETKEMIINSGLKQTQIAKALGISDSNLSYKLRRNVTHEFYLKTIEAISLIKSETK